MKADIYIYIYPIYRRRNARVYVIKNNCIIDNRNVILYSPCFAKRFDAHINIKIVSNIRLVKYIFKYILKNYNRAAIQTQDRLDKIKRHFNTR